MSAGFSGMDIGEVERLADLLDLQAKAVAAVTFVVDHTVAGLMASWIGSDLDHFAGSWHQTHRPRTVGVSERLEALVAQLRAQARDQQVASAALSATAVSFPGGGSKLRASDILAFAKGSEGSSVKLPPGWSAVDPAGLRQLGIEPGSLHDRGTGLDATIYSDGHGHYVISYAGTAGDWKSRDWVEDYKGIASPLLANASGQTQGAVDLARELTGKVGADNVTLTGHSLGGRDAATASIATGCRAVTFNAAGVTDEDVMYAREVSGHHVSLGDYVLGKLTDGDSLRGNTDPSLVTNYTITDDIVTDGQAAGHALIGTHEAYGEQVVVPTDTLDPLDAHGLDNFDGRL